MYDVTNANGGIEKNIGQNENENNAISYLYSFIYYNARSFIYNNIFIVNKKCILIHKVWK